jgi:hypothetical protein
LQASGEGNLRELIDQLTQSSQDLETYKAQHLPRLSAAKVPGFESNKYLNLKLNQKLLKKGEEPVDLERDCP